MAAESGTSTSSVPDTTDSLPLVSDANHTSADALEVEDHFHISDHLDATGGSHIDSGGSAPYITDPTPSIPDVNHPSVDMPADDKDHFHISDPSDTAGGCHIDNVDQMLPLTEP